MEAKLLKNLCLSVSESLHDVSCMSAQYQMMLPYLDAYSDWALDQTTRWDGQLLIFIAYFCGTMINVPSTILSVVLGYTFKQGDYSFWSKIKIV